MPIAPWVEVNEACAFLRVTLIALLLDREPSSTFMAVDNRWLDAISGVRAMPNRCWYIVLSAASAGTFVTLTVLLLLPHSAKRQGGDHRCCYEGLLSWCS